MSLSYRQLTVAYPCEDGNCESDQSAEISEFKIVSLHDDALSHENISPFYPPSLYLILTACSPSSFDNSDYQRNGDYFPTRLNVQKDGINLVCQTKVRSNPENNVGLLTLSK